MNQFFQPASKKVQHPKGKSCLTCGLFKAAKTPNMPPHGKFKKEIMVIGEAPGEIEDLRGKPWQGKMGIILYKELQSFGIDLYQDCISINACLCRPPENETPSSHHIQCCQRKVVDTIQRYKPKAILLVGGCAVESVMPIGDSKITKWRGFLIPDTTYGAWIMPVFHPSYVERQKKTNIITTVWKKDLQKFADSVQKPFPHKVEPDFIFINNEKDFKLALKDIAKTRGFAIDYEATGIRPYADGHALVSTSVAVSGQRAFAWLNNPKRDALFGKVMKNPKFKKIAHNTSMEDVWTKVKLGVQTQWYWDTMIVAHLLDNRGGITGLKKQAYLNFGVPDYSSHLEAYLKSEKKKHGANGINNIFGFINDYGHEELLKYNAYDSIYTYKLAKKQQEELNVKNT